MKEKAFEYIDALAAKLGVAAEHVYGVLVKQASVTGLTTIISVITVITVLAAISIISYKASNKDWDDDVSAVIFIGSSILLTVGFILSAFLIPIGVMQVLNPEYYAIKEILEVIGGGK